LAQLRFVEPPIVVAAEVAVVQPVSVELEVDSRVVDAAVVVAASLQPLLMWLAASWSHVALAELQLYGGDSMVLLAALSLAAVLELVAL